MIYKIIEGNNVRLVIIAINKIVDVKAPKTTVPPKEENVNIINPKKRINDVKTMLLPVSKIVFNTDSLMFLEYNNSFLYFAKKWIE